MSETITEMQGNITDSKIAIDDLGMWVERMFEKRQLQELDEEPQIRAIITMYGNVWLFIGDSESCPQITDIEVESTHRGKGYGEKLFLLAVNYLSQNSNLAIREEFQKFGIGTSRDTAKGFWEHMSTKYGGKRGTNVGKFQGEWYFPSHTLPMLELSYPQQWEIKFVEREAQLELSGEAEVDEM